VLLERRRERAFGPEDWDVLRILSSQAEAALLRVRLWERIATLSRSDPATGLGGGSEHVRAVLAHAAAAASWGEPASVAMLRLEGLGGAALRHGPAEAARLMRGVAEVVRDTAQERGIVLRYSDDELLVVLPGMDTAATAALVADVRARLAYAVAVHAGIVEHGGGPAFGIELAERALAAVPARGHAGAPV